MRGLETVGAALVAALAATLADPASHVSPAVREFVAVDARVVALTHVRLVDGTGAATIPRS